MVAQVADLCGLYRGQIYGFTNTCVCINYNSTDTSVGKTIYLATDHPKRTAPYCRHLTDQPQRTATPPIVPPPHGPATEEYPSAERYSSAGGPQGFISLEYQICPSRRTI